MRIGNTNTTELQLLKEVAGLLRDEILPKIDLLPDMKVYLHDLPLSADYEEEAARDEEDDNKYFPCCIVRLSHGKIETFSSPQTVTVEMIVIVKDWSEEMEGYQNIMIVIDRIRDELIAQHGIRGRFRLAMPMEWALDTSSTTPWFVGSIRTTWETDYMRYRDVDRFL